MDYAVLSCARADVVGVYFSRSPDVWVIGNGTEEGDTQIVRLDDRWVFTIAGGGVAMRSTVTATDLRMCAWEAFMPDAGGWVDCPATIVPVERGVSISSDKGRVNGVYLLAGEHNGMPMWESAGCRLYFHNVWIVSESASHVAKCKGVLKSAATEGMPYQQSLLWWASNSAARGWIPTQVTMHAVENTRDGAAVWKEARHQQHKLAALEGSIKDRVVERAPEQLCVTAPQYPVLQGVYTRIGELKNGLPKWEKTSTRADGRSSWLYGDTRGHWCFSNAGDRHLGRDTSLAYSALHQGRTPHEVTEWLDRDGHPTVVEVRLVEDGADPQPPPTPSHHSTITEVEVNEELCANEWAPSDDAVRCRLFVFFQRVGYKWARETPPAEDVIDAIRAHRTTLDEVMASLCAKAAVPVQPWLSAVCEAVVEYIVNALHVRHNNFSALPSVALAAKAVCSGKVNFAQYMIGLCRQYAASAAEWVGDFPAAIRPLPEDERLVAYLEEELGMPMRQGGGAQAHQYPHPPPSHTGAAPPLTHSNVSGNSLARRTTQQPPGAGGREFERVGTAQTLGGNSSRLGPMPSLVGSYRDATRELSQQLTRMGSAKKHSRHHVPLGSVGDEEVSVATGESSTLTQQVDDRLEKLALLETLRDAQAQQEAISKENLQHVRALQEVLHVGGAAGAGALSPRHGDGGPAPAIVDHTQDIQELKQHMQTMQQQQLAFQRETLALFTSRHHAPGGGDAAAAEAGAPAFPHPAQQQRPPQQPHVSPRRLPAAGYDGGIAGGGLMEAIHAHAPRGDPVAMGVAGGGDAYLAQPAPAPLPLPLSFSPREAYPESVGMAHGMPAAHLPPTGVPTAPGWSPSPRAGDVAGGVVGVHDAGGHFPYPLAEPRPTGGPAATVRAGSYVSAASGLSVVPPEAGRGFGATAARPAAMRRTVSPPYPAYSAVMPAAAR